MNKGQLYLLLLFSQILGLQINAQSCLPSGITFTTQEAVDAFPQEYPGCKEIGSVFIQGDDITNLDSLIQLEKAQLLWAYDLNNLNSLAGLGNVDTISQDLLISECPQLENLDGLDNLNFAESIALGNNATLQNIDAIANIQEVTRIFSIEKNPLLERINGFNNISKLINLKIIDNSGLTEIVGFNNIDTISNGCQVVDNIKVRNLDLLHNLQYVDGFFDLINIDTLDVFSGFEKLEYADFLSIQRIYHTDSMPSFNALKRIEGTMELGTIQGMKSFNGFQNLEHVKGTLHIIHLDSLLTFIGFNSLDSVSSRLDLDQCDSLKTLTGFNNLKFVGSSFEVGGFYFLTQMDAFKTLNWIGGEFHMQSNKKLHEFPFQSLEHIGGRIWVTGNKLLQNLKFLDKLDYTTVDSLSIFGNDSLRICNTYPICKYLEEDIGPYDIRLNYEGCNSAVEILELCATNSTSILEDSDIYLYPNPSRDVLTISGLYDYHFVPIEIFNAMGIQVLQKLYTTEPIDISMLSGGTYYIALHVDGARRVIPFVKI